MYIKVKHYSICSFCVIEIIFQDLPKINLGHGNSFICTPIVYRASNICRLSVLRADFLKLYSDIRLQFQKQEMFQLFFVSITFFSCNPIGIVTR